MDLKNYKHIYMCGIGGISMSGLAEILTSWNFTVSGSDGIQSKITDHLIEKGINVIIGQKEENRRFATKLFDKLGMSAESATLAHFIIGEGQEYTSDYYVKKNPQAMPQLLEACKKELTVTYGREPTKAEIDALCNMCRVVQTCDSGAYTRYAVTRDSQDGFYYHNGNDRFTDNAQAQGINHDRIRLKNPPKPPTQ
jgi:hypothetical protein